MYAGAVFFQGIAQGVFHIALVLGVFHIDKIDHHQTAQVAQTHLAGDFFGGFQIGFKGGFFNIGTTSSAGGVHIHRHQRFGVVDHNRAAGRQAHAAREGAFNLMLDLETGKQRGMVVVELQAADVVRHHIAHEFGNLLVNFGVIDQDFADVGAEIVADGADYQRAFHKQQIRLVVRTGGFFNRLPQLLQIVEIPFQFFHAATDTGGTRNQAHAARHFQLGHHRFQFLAIFAFNTARHATTTRVVRHQHQITAGQADKSGECCAFIAALVFFHLHDHLHAFFQHVLNACAAAVVILEIGTGNFFEREKTVAVGAVIDKTRFQRRFDAGNHTFIDIAFTLLFAQRFDVQIQQGLSINNRYAQLFGLRSIE